MVVLGTKPLLELGPPAIEELLRRGIESQERHLLRRQLLGAYRGGIQPVEALNTSIARPRAAASGQRSTFRHRPATSGHTAS
jgi:hypothetical protein